MAVQFKEIHAREWAWRQSRIDDYIASMQVLGVARTRAMELLHAALDVALRDEGPPDDGDHEDDDPQDDGEGRLTKPILKGGPTDTTAAIARAQLEQELPDRRGDDEEWHSSILTGAASIFLELLVDHAWPEIRDPDLVEIAKVLENRQLIEWAQSGGTWLVLPASQYNNARALDHSNELYKDEVRFGAIVGRLIDRRILPRFEELPEDRTNEDRDPVLQRDDIRSVQGWVERRHALFTIALPEIQRIVVSPNRVSRIDESHWANAVDRIDGDGIGADSPYIKQVVEEAMAPFVGLTASGTGEAFGSIDGGGGRRGSWVDISLPDLEAEAAVDIVKDNIEAMQAIYFAATLEDLKFFQVMDKLLEMFNIGVLPFGRGSAGDKLYHYWKNNFNRFTELERHNIYARALGRPGGDVGMGSPNRQFQDLFLRFVSSVSEWRRQVQVDDLLRSGKPYTVSDQQVRKSARDLASNLSLFGYGIAHYAATELQRQIRQILIVLRDEEVKASYGARDVWQVIDQVATLELGGARNSVRYRTMANSGAIIIRWLAKHAGQVSQTGFATLLSRSDLEPPSSNGTRRDPLSDPVNFDLIQACEQYLAVTGTPETSVDEYAQPALGPDQTGRPIQIPGVARDMFESVGVNPSDFGLN